MKRLFYIGVFAAVAITPVLAIGSAKLPESAKKLIGPEITALYDGATISWNNFTQKAPLSRVVAAAQKGDVSMAKKFLVHIHTGPENPTTAALGFLVAATALKQGHHVDLFLAGDGALLISDAQLTAVEGKGTGKLAEHYKVLSEGGARFYISGMSAKARGLGDKDLNGKPAEFAMPDVLVRLASEADVVLTY